MDKDQEEIIQFYKEKIEPFMALFVLAFLITGCVLLYQDNQLKEQIAETCGYEKGENYICYCEHDFVTEKKLMSQPFQGINISAVNISDDEV